MLRSFTITILLVLCASSLAGVVGKWQGVALMGPSKIAQTMDSDALLKLQMSKAFLKSMNYQLEIKSDGTFVSLVRGADMRRRKSTGTWKISGTLLTLSSVNENGVKANRTLTASVQPDGKKIVIVVPSKPGLPVTKLVFAKVPEPVVPTKPSSAAKPTRA